MTTANSQSGKKGGGGLRSVVSLAWVMVEKFGTVAISIVTFFVFAKFLGPEEFGIGVFAMSIAQFLVMAFTSLFQDILVQKKVVSNDDSNTNFWSCVISGGVGAALLVIGSFIWALHGDQRVAMMSAVGAIQIPLTAISLTHTALLRREGRFKTLAARTLVGRLLGAAVSVAMVFGGFGAWSLVLQPIAMSAFATATLWFMSPWRPSFQFNAKLMVEHLRFGAPLAVRGMTYDIFTRAIPIVVGLFAGHAATGIVTLAWRIVELPRSAISTGLIGFSLPLMSRRQDNIDQLQTAYLKLTRATTLVTCAVFLGECAIAGPLIRIIFGEVWASAIPTTQIFAVAAAWSFAQQYSGVALTAMGRPSALLGFHLGSTVVALALFPLLLLAGMGPVAAGVVQVLRLIFLTGPNFLVLRRIMSLSVTRQFSAIGPAFAAGATMVAVTLSVERFLEGRMGDPAMIALLLVLGGTVYLGVLTLLDRKWISEVRDLMPGRRAVNR